MNQEQLTWAIKQNQRFLEQANRAITTVENQQNDLLNIQQYPFVQSDARLQKAVTESYAAQAELCGKLSAALTSSELCGWEAPDVCRELYRKQQLQQQQVAHIELLQKDGYALIQMPHPLLRYHLKKTDAPFLDALEQTLCSVPFPRGFAAQKIFAFWHIYPHAGWARRSLPDNDNYLLKPVIDTVCRVWGMTDTGDELALFYNSTRDDTVPDRTYLLICTKDAGFPFYDWQAIKALLCP